MNRDFAAEFDVVKTYAVNNYKSFKKAADSACIIKYGTESDGIGVLYPKAYRAICRGRYGRYIKDYKKYSDYTVYEFAADNKPLRIQKLHDGRCTETIYFFELDGRVYAAVFYADTGDFFGATDIFRFVYENDRLMSFAFFSGWREDIFTFDYTMFPHMKMTEQDKHKRDDRTDVYTFEYDLGSRGKICNLRRIET